MANKVINNKADAGKELPTEVKLLNWGKNETTQGDVWLTDKTMDVFDWNQKTTGRDKNVALDFGHNTVSGSKEWIPGKAKDIAGYGNPKLVKGDGLYLTNIKYTPIGKEKALNYKDLSPAIKTDEHGVLEWLDSAALVPNGSVNNLMFLSADILNNMKTENMSVTDKGGSNAKSTLIMDGDDYNKDGANAGVKKVGDKYELKPHVNSADDDDDEDEEDNKNPIKHAKDCMCSYCMADDMGIYEADDHYSKYGDVKYADAENHKYPIDTEKHVRAAWSYINMPKNADKYDSTKLSTIKSHIKTAAKKFGISISDDKEKTETKTMSAKIPDAYKAQPNQYNTMNNTIIKKMAAEVGMDGESDQEKVLFAFLAKYEELVENSKLIIKKENTEEGGLKQFSAQLEDMKNIIKSINADKELEKKNNEEFQKDEIVNQAIKDGKYFTLSADTVKSLSVTTLKEIVNGLPKGQIPMTSRMKTLNASAASAQEGVSVVPEDVSDIIKTYQIKTLTAQNNFINPTALKNRAERFKELVGINKL